MIKLVPDPPKNPLTAFYSFGPCQGDTPVFAVRDGFPVDAMLGKGDSDQLLRTPPPQLYLS